MFHPVISVGFIKLITSNLRLFIRLVYIILLIVLGLRSKILDYLNEDGRAVARAFLDHLVALFRSKPESYIPEDRGCNC